jgi:hypothetical protein
VILFNPKSSDPEIICELTKDIAEVEIIDDDHPDVF